MAPHAMIEEFKPLVHQQDALKRQSLILQFKSLVLIGTRSTVNDNHPAVLSYLIDSSSTIHLIVLACCESAIVRLGKLAVLSALIGPKVRYGWVKPTQPAQDSKVL
jgi:hypothetical protein